MPGKENSQKYLRMISESCKRHSLCRVTAQVLLGTITHVLTQNGVAALTFDDGPHPEWTPRVLDLLKKHQAKATFFMIGQAAKKYPELVRRVAIDRHAIANHSYSHFSFHEIDRQERHRQIRDCQKAIAPYGLRLFRPPHGHQSVSSRVDVFLLRYKVIGWSVSVRDWESRNKDWIANQLIDQVEPGSIVLLHDSLYVTRDHTYRSREQMLEALDIFLGRMHGKLGFITLPELFQKGRVVAQNWYRGGQLSERSTFNRMDVS